MCASVAAQVAKRVSIHSLPESQLSSGAPELVDFVFVACFDELIVNHEEGDSRDIIREWRERYARHGWRAQR